MNIKSEEENVAKLHDIQEEDYDKEGIRTDFVNTVVDLYGQRGDVARQQSHMAINMKRWKRKLRSKAKR